VIKTRFLRSFDESFRGLPPREAASAESVVSRLIDYFSGRTRPPGLGLRKLKGRYWEIRASLDLRILFLLEEDTATFVIVGNHDAIRRRLRARH
jgi:hypothetical protein